MKFTYGQWVSKEGYNISKLVQVVDYTYNDDELILHISFKPITNRSLTLDTALMKVTISSPINNVISVNLCHHEGSRNKIPKYSLKQSNNDISFIENKDTLEYISGKSKVKIDKDRYCLKFYYDDKYCTSSNDSCAYIQHISGENYVREQLSLSVGENVYGLGERFTSFIRNGQVIKMWNEDGGTSSEISYKNIPFYVTSKGYGIFVNDTGDIAYEIASENVEKVQFSAQKENLEYCFIGGSNIKDTLITYSDLTGRPPMPPAWSFGLWLSTSFTTDYDIDTVMSFINGMIDRDIPLQVFHFDCFWMKAYQWCDFIWDSDVFPNPKEMLYKLKEKGLKICVWINPYIAQKSSMFKEGMDNNYFINKTNGDVWQTDKWQAGMAVVDFTNPDAVKWYQNKLKALLDMGVDCFKTDFGERIPTDVSYFDKSDPIHMHNYYTYLYNKIVYDLLIEERGEGEAVLFARSATATCQQFPVHWGGDCWGTYESMAESLRGGLSLGLGGFGYWSHDIGGFEQASPAHVYKRWVQFGLLSSHSRLHGSNSYRVPWLYDEEAVDVLRKFTKLKASLMPYIITQAKYTSTTGIPMLRAMVLEFNDDPVCKNLDLQYMLGDSLLVAPIFNEQGDVCYYLPEGKWTNLLTNEIKEGNKYHNENHDFMSLPLMVRSNTILPMSSVCDKTVYNYTKDIEFHIFNIECGKTCEVEVIDPNTEKNIAIKVENNNQVLNVNIEGEISNVKIVLRNIHSIKNANEYNLSYDSLGIVIDALKSMVIKL